MKTATKWTSWLGVGAIVLASVAGCGNDKNGNGSVADEGTKAVAGATDNASEAASNVADAGQNQVAGAGKAIEGAADAAVNTPKIKTALGANAAMGGSKIDVDTNGAANTINLTGMVKSDAQKKMAEAIAKKEAGANYKINNQLKVMAGGKMGAMKKGG